jgi:hypothetical protein
MKRRPSARCRIGRGLPAAAMVFAAWLATLTSAGAQPVPAAAHYANGFPTDPGFFPLGVWLQSPKNAASYQAIGINTFVGLWEGPTEVQLAALAGHGMFAVAAQNEIGLGSANRGVIKAWLQEDEPDDAQPGWLRRYQPCIPAAEVARRSRELKARDATRPVMLNFGPGVADESWPGRGTCTGDLRYYDRAVEGADILSFDIYPVANDRVEVAGKLEYVARGVANLLKRAAPGRSVWAAIETTSIRSGHRVTPAQLRAEVWMALLHGATGIFYFVHEWSSGFREDGIFRYPEIVREVAAVDRTITALAPVLNSPSLAGKVTVSAPVPIAVMAKQQADALYVFAAAMQDAPSTARFAIRGLADAEAQVIGEDRAAAVANGTLEDAFPGYGVHLYRIPVGKDDRNR